tara:strand:+ start:1066 stop:1920 length:855 start_codon:yes stop_codon:yes gene_type:complete
VFGQDTFSIVAVDTITMEVGSAGASCIDGSIIISDILPGTGAIHAQSFWNQSNQNNAHDWMEEGHTAQEIIDLLINNDTQNNPSIRQYGIVTLDTVLRSAAYTGENCYNYKNHIIGPNYAIQGNILLGQEVLDSIEFNFLNTEGPLYVKLMAAIQGANISGADSRCLQFGTSSLSSFLRLAKEDNNPDSLYIDINVNSVDPGAEPLDSLQVLFDNWFVSTHPFVIGDVDRDSVIGISDLLIILDFSMGDQGPTYFQSFPSDFDGNNIINIGDVFHLTNFLLNLN